MIVSLNWLKEYVELDSSVDVKEICDRLTMTGTKVEKYVKFGEKVDKVYAARVESVDRHPLDNDLKKLIVTTGEQNYSVVAKITDVQKGDVVPLALEGATIPNKEIKAQEIKSVLSNAMICHMNDLGLNKELYSMVKPSGLISLPKTTPLGMDINEVLGLGDYLIEFEITPNRPDCLAVEGLARELAITFGTTCKPLWQDKVVELKKVKEIDGLSVDIETTTCERYMANVAKNITITEAPYDMQIKLLKSGLSVKNNIVDITNFVMLEIGQPLHAFDKNAVGNKIIVKLAKEGQEMEMIDNETRVLSSNMMVISSDKANLAVAGVMGSLDSAIKPFTKNIVFESATFIRGSIRETTKRLGLRSDASHRFEKGLSAKLVESAMARVCDLMNANGYSEEMNCTVIDDNDTYTFENKIILDCDKINSILGLSLTEYEIVDILKGLNMKLEFGIITVPYYRQDVLRIEDLAEEIARIYGYEKLNSTLPVMSTTFANLTPMQKFEEELKTTVLNKGFNEIYTYSFFSEETLKKVTLGKNSELNNLIKLVNPLSIDFEYMRTTTIPHMLEALDTNYSKKNVSPKLFELARVFLDPKKIKDNELPTEEMRLSLGFYDNTLDFYYLKDVVMSILAKHKINPEIRRSEFAALHPGISADIYVGDKLLARLGKVNPKVIANYNLPENTYVAEIYIQNMLDLKVSEIKYKELPKYPAVERDIALVVDSKVLSSDLIKVMKNTSDLVEDVKLFDVYQGKQIAEGKKSLAYQIILRDLNKTLTEDEITKVITEILTNLNKEFEAEIRK